MKKGLLSLAFISCLLLCAAPAEAQSVARGIDPAVIRDAGLEKESLHNLNVARHYFKLKKAYRAALNRTEEIIAGNPNFARIDEALYIAGMSSLYLSENKGKQAPLVAQDKLREQAREYLSRVVTEFPDSDFRKDAEAELRGLGEQKPEARSQ